MTLTVEDDARLLAGWRLDGRRRGLEESSLRKREDDMRCVARTLDPIGLLAASESDLQEFVDQRRWHGKPIGDRTRYSWISTMSSFYQWAIRNDHLGADPTARMIRPRLRRLLPRPWLAVDMEEAVDAAVPTVRCWLLLAAYAGFRVCEMSRLCRDDVLDGQAPQLLVAHGKGSKDRAVPLHPRVLTELQMLPLPRRGFVFPAADGGQRSAASISQAVAHHFDDLGMQWTAHQGRHWFATNVLEASGGDLRMVQELLGHESITTTTIYTMWSKRRAVEAVNGLPSRPDRATMSA